MNRILCGAVAAALFGCAAMADGVRVVADIAPVHSLVARVMQGVNSPTLVLRAGDSPHDFALRPSTAKALQDADVVFWVGHVLTPSLEDTLGTVAENATIIELSETDGVTQLAYREGAVFDDDHGDDHSDDHHNDHDHEHDADGLDPHMWLDPENASVWLTEIARVLQAEDPQNASIYEVNAKAAQKEMALLTQQTQSLLAPFKGESFVVFHDAYQYFENRFGLNAAGAILIAGGDAPSAARLRQVGEEISHEGITCVFSEPQFDSRIVSAVSSHANTAELDPMGVDIQTGPDHYPALIRNLAQSVANCLGS